MSCNIWNAGDFQNISDVKMSGILAMNFNKKSYICLLKLI
jgi:hypothetical protein